VELVTLKHYSHEELEADKRTDFKINKKLFIIILKWYSENDKKN